jgi:hypothetical protein
VLAIQAVLDKGLLDTLVVKDLLVVEALQAALDLLEVLVTLVVVDLLAAKDSQVVLVTQEVLDLLAAKGLDLQAVKVTQEAVERASMDTQVVEDLLEA